MRRRVIFRFGLVLATVLFASLLLIGLRPTDDTDLRALLLPPDGCAAPCWAGIRPGETTSDEALAILGAHPWVASIDASTSDGRQIGNIRFRWEARRYLNPNIDNIISMAYASEVVDTVALRTEVPLGAMWLMLGPPDFASVRPPFAFGVMPGATTALSYNASYSEGNLQVNALPNCPNTPYTIWNATVQEVYITATLRTLTLEGNHDIAPLLNSRLCTPIPIAVT